MPIIGQPTANAQIVKLAQFIAERHYIYRRKDSGEPKPWTSDPIFLEWRFCNMYRELDTETVWIANNWRDPHSTDPDLWFAMSVARLVNWHESLEEIEYPVPWNPERFIEVLESRQQRKLKAFTGAYKVPAPGPGFKMSKAEYIANHVLTPMWNDRERLRKMSKGTLAEACQMLVSYRSIGNFIAGQIIADLKYVKPMRDAPDWWSWAASGPGSRRGLNRVLNRPVDASWNEPDWLIQLQKLHTRIAPMLKAAKLRRMHAQDLQNALCEWDKYERVRLGEGAPRSKYPGLGSSPK